MSTAASSPHVWVNDVRRSLPASGRLADLLVDLGMAQRQGLAVAVNGAVVSRASWNEATLAADDRVLVIHASQGG
jgi:sulfur carrier protein